jgi:hypothetical protein
MQDTALSEFRPQRLGGCAPIIVRRYFDARYEAYVKFFGLSGCKRHA